MTRKLIHRRGASAAKVFTLSHDIRPETRAMLCAMVSRMPSGGIAQRYSEVVDAAALSILERDLGVPCENLPGGSDVDDEYRNELRRAAEYELTRRIPPQVQKFMDDFVGKYGHASILELTGDPTVFVENVSWWTAWLSFDSPLARGQELSTRAKAYRDWPLCTEAFSRTENLAVPGTGMFGEDIQDAIPVPFPDPGLAELHLAWLDVFGAELDWWQQHLASAENRAALGISDNEPFRPAYDRARWALPGTIATGFAHTGNLRDMSRVVQVALAFAMNVQGGGGSQSPVDVWKDVLSAYEAALPAFAGYGLRGAVTTAEQEKNAYRKVPGHLLYWQECPEMDAFVRATEDVGALLTVSSEDAADAIGGGLAYRRDGVGYIDPTFNRIRADVVIRCSLAVARDWHRHRTLYPWTLRPVMKGACDFEINRAYAPRSVLGIAQLPVLMRRSTEVYMDLLRAGDHYRAILALPLGTDSLMYGHGGLRDVLYMLELRSRAHGTNFEYRAQAEMMLNQLKNQITLEDL